MSSTITKYDNDQHEEMFKKKKTYIISIQCDMAETLIRCRQVKTNVVCFMPSKPVVSSTKCHHTERQGGSLCQMGIRAQFQ